eukprot:TRINITY_DN1473_c1_g1_i3.p1 TRINITY_DN1473_c1_g1~~TRINITY_DN1473_c1_g1_i3.p1  ORF type:complete len:134 (+),score=13.34 TRINITY_DN1473_c1_g1_i3:45-446(+)
MNNESRKRTIEETGVSWRLGSTNNGECIYFLSGFCRLGDRCPFSHGNEAREPEVQEEGLPPQKRVKLISTKVTDQRVVRKIRTDECSICLETLSKPKIKPIIKLTSCKHYFHEQCITEWLGYGDACPVCSRDL